METYTQRRFRNVQWRLRGACLNMDGKEDLASTTQCLDTISDVTMPVRLLHLLKENRIEMMIATILLYSTGLLEQAWTYSQGVC